MEFVSGKLTDLHLAGLSDCDTSPAPYGLAECPSQLAADCQLKHLLLQYWGSVIRSVYTLFQAMCGGVDWGLVAEPLVEITPVMGLLFCMYIAVAVFCVMNIVTGVFVENAKMMTAQDETNQIMENMEKRRIWFNAVKELWRTLDEEGVGELDLHRFAESLSDVRTQVFFEKMGIEVTTESVEGLFTLLDFNGNGKVDIDELALGIQMLHGSAKGIDVARVSYSTMMVRKQLDELVDFCFIEIPKIIGIKAFEAEDLDELGEQGDEVVELGSLNTPASPKSDKGGEPGSPSGRAKEGLADIALRRRSTRRCFSPGKETFPGGANQQCPLDAHVENFRRHSLGYGAKNSVAPLKSGSMSGGSLSSLAASLGLGRMTASPSTTSTVHMESHDDGLHRPDCPIGRQDDGVHRLDRPMSRQHSPKRSHSPQSPYPP
uniref:EF-hand domain-containing protein n=1 Tax=Zooxanthella nutricula TaxID=1333877 RepID=A0A7S2INN8_9DINO